MATSSDYEPSGSLESPRRGTCFGFAIRSALPFRLLRPGPGEPLSVEEGDDGQDDAAAHLGPPAVEWNLREDRPFHARLHLDGPLYRLWVDDTGWFTIDPAEPSVKVPACADQLRREERLLAIPALLCLLHRGDLGLHAAAVQIGGGALVVGAPGKQGKTTLAAAFHNAGFRVLAEDITCCRPSDPPVLFPGPALLRVRRDSYERMTFPNTQVLAEERHRVHLAIRDGVRGDAQPLPIHGVVLLREASTDAALVPVPPTEAVPDLWALSFTLPTDQARAEAFAKVVDLARSTPVWNLVRPLSYETLPQVVDHLVAAFDDGR